MMETIRETVRDLFTPGGWRRHPVLCAIALVVLVVIVLGLLARPL